MLSALAPDTEFHYDDSSVEAGRVCQISINFQTSVGEPLGMIRIAMFVFELGV